MQRYGLRRGMLAGTAAVILAATIASPVAAECFPRAPATTAYSIETAFIATVSRVATDFDEEVAAAGEGDGYKWVVDARVERVFRGSVGDVVSWEGHTLSHLSCGQDLLGDQLEVNDRLFVAAEADPGYGPRLLVWRWMNGRWRFADEALQDVANGGEPYPGAARDVHTTAAILRLIDRLPDTSTDEQIHGDDVGTAADWSTAREYVVGSIFLATFWWLTAHPTRHRRRDLTAIDAVRGAPNQAVVPEADAG